MRFSHPGWLPAALVAVVGLIWLWRIYDARQHAALAKFVAARLRQQLTRSISLGWRRTQRSLFLAAIICLFVALAGPLYGFRWEQVSRRGNEVIFAIDTSRSMLTPDVKPSRLTRAKLAIDDFVKQLDGDAVGIVAFAGTAFLACPVTLDYGAFHESLSAVDTNTIPRGGTNISSAIEAAQVALRRRPTSDKILILVTDGEELEGSAVDAARAAAASDGLRIFTVGVGTAAGDLIPIPQAQGGGFVQDETGAFIRSRLDESRLKAIAAATKGFYAPLGTQGEGLDAVFKTVLGPSAKHDLASRQQKIYTERYQWPLGTSLVLLLASLLVGTRRRSVAQSSAGAVSFATLLYSSILVMNAHVQGSHAADANEHSAAAPDSSGADSKKPVLEYNAGTAAYRAGRFSQAAQSFQQSISHAPSNDSQPLAVQQDAYYNLGNTLYRAGQKTEQASPQETLQKWNAAVKAYETALQLRADDSDSQYNRDLVKRKIDALKQQQDRNNQQNKDQNDKNQSDKDKQKQGQNQSKTQPQNRNQGGAQPDNREPPRSSGQGVGAAPPQAEAPKGEQATPDAGQAPASPNSGEPQPRAENGEEADNQRLPGQMTREEARELLDSVKGDERHSLGAPVAQRSGVRPPEKPFKNW